MFHFSLLFVLIIFLKCLKCTCIEVNQSTWEMETSFHMLCGGKTLVMGENCQHLHIWNNTSDLTSASDRYNNNGNRSPVLIYHSLHSFSLFTHLHIIIQSVHCSPWVIPPLLTTGLRGLWACQRLGPHRRRRERPRTCKCLFLLYPYNQCVVWWWFIYPGKIYYAYS